jgi:hypothetical protein
MSQNPFNGLSKTTLQSALLENLNAIAELKKESRTYRRRLSEVRSILQLKQFQLRQIQHALELPSVLNLPQPVLPVEPQLKRKFGRWGKVTWELESPSEDSSKTNPLKESQRKAG